MNVRSMYLLTYLGLGLLTYIYVFDFHWLYTRGGA